VPPRRRREDICASLVIPARTLPAPEQSLPPLSNHLKRKPRRGAQQTRRGPDPMTTALDPTHFSGFKGHTGLLVNREGQGRRNWTHRARQASVSTRIGVGRAECPGQDDKEGGKKVLGMRTCAGPISGTLLPQKQIRGECTDGGILVELMGGPTCPHPAPAGKAVDNMSDQEYPSGRP
jgi:hypothetical protein